MPLFRKVQPPFGLKTLVKDSNCVLIQDPSAIWGGSDHLPRRNLLLATDALATQNVTVTAEAHTLYLQGTGSVTLSGTGSGTLQGTGANDRVSLAFTPTAGTLTLTVSGTVTFGMLCKSSVTDRSYQRITDWVTEQYAWAAQKNVPWLRRNRFLNTATLSTQTVTAVTANPITVSFTGTGKIDFTTAYTGTLQGTGASDRVTATFTPAAGNLVCTVTGSVTLAQCEVGSTATPYQEVGASWAATYTSLAIAAGYPISLYSDRTGTTATYGPDDPVGVLLDQKNRLILGPELISNGGFASSTGWTLETSWSIGSGLLTCAGGQATSYYAFTSSAVATTGKTYLCTITFSSVSNYYARVFFEGGYGYSPGINAQGTYTSIMSPGQANSKLFIQNISGLFVGSIDQISLREILNYNYAIAPSDAARPNLRLDGNGKFYLDRDTTDDDLPITWPTNLTTTGVIYTATGDYTTKDSGLTLSGLTSYKFPQRPSGDYGRIVMAAESKYDAKIIKYLDAKRGRSYQLGPELVSNYNFATGDLTGWTVAGNNATNTVAYEGGACRFIADGSSILTLSPTVGTIAVGKAYLIIANQLSATGQGIRLNTASPGVLTYIPIAVGVYSFAIVATGTNVVLQRTAAGSASNVLLKSLSVREIIL